MKKSEFNFEEGEVLLIDKPLEWTSFNIVTKIRNTGKIKKIGHAGTLDPLATGLLILCTGKMTKQIENFQGMEKEYEGELVLGKSTPSYDLETEVDCEKDISHINKDYILLKSKDFIGNIMQVPPIFSAIRVGGERLYKKARRGEDVKIEPREVFVKEFEITGIELPIIKFRIICSKGTYIRSLVRDFGEALGACAYMSGLRRTRIGDFCIADAYDIENIADLVKKNRA